MTTTRHVHLIAVCGTAMGALAGMLKQLGWRVTGSDSGVYPPMSTQLAEQGIEVWEGFDEAHLQPHPDLVVIGNAMSRGNPEVEYALREGLEYTSMAAAIEEWFLQDRTSLVVTGTHGKSTTTTLLAWLLYDAGADPSFLVGGVPLNFDRGWRIGAGEHFVIEGDEYDTAFFDKESKFLHYRPHIAILTGIEFDHADIFDDVEQIEAAFAKFVGLIPVGGTLLVAHDSARARRVAQAASCTVWTYGLDEEAHWRAADLTWERGCARFTLVGPEGPVTRLQSPLLGTHNLHNTLAACAAALRAGIEPQALASALARHRGIKRRQEVIGTPRDVVVIDDFAHHPTAVRATLAALRQGYPQRRLWALFEPRSNTTQRAVFQDEYVDAFAGADRVIITRLHRPEKVEAGHRLDPAALVHALQERGVWARYEPDVDAIVQTVCQGVEENHPEKDLVAILSNGAFYGIHGKLLNALGSSV